jgi:hypothetical protein
MKSLACLLKCGSVPRCPSFNEIYRSPQLKLSIQTVLRITDEKAHA